MQCATCFKVLWDGRLARPDWAGKMPTPQLGFQAN